MVRRRDHRFVELAEQEFTDVEQLQTLMFETRYCTIGGILPVGRRQRYIDGGRQRPSVGSNLIEALVVERSHQLGIDRLTGSITDRERPFLLLSWFQTVAERSPLQFQLFVGQRTSYLGSMRVAVLILHPGKGQHQTVLIGFLVSQLEVEQTV